MDNQYRSCGNCGEYRKPTLRKNENNLCHNCADKTHSHGHCWICRKHDLPIEHHHLAGKKHAEKTVPVCLNCHAMLSRRQYQWPDLWRGESCGVFLLIGFMDYCALYTDPTMPLDMLSEKSQKMAQDAIWKAIDMVVFIIKLMPLVIILLFALKMLRTSTFRTINGV